MLIHIVAKVVVMVLSSDVLQAEPKKIPSAVPGFEDAQGAATRGGALRQIR